MTAQATRTWTRFALAVIIASVVIASGILALTYLGHAATVTETATTTTVKTTQPLLISRSSGSWTFNVSMNATSVEAGLVGQSILISANATYLGFGNTSVPQVRLEPPIIVTVFNSTRGFVWGNAPGEVQIEINETVTHGWNLGGRISIPTSGMVPGMYSVLIEPPLSSYPQSDVSDLGKSLQITANFTVL